ncbi:MAG TPA: PilZ domain-containing protein [Terriglobales bacterium]|jgi:hypothetical protein|nr:PilZ domain-containing protein [Terriglobales bacterium]
MVHSLKNNAASTYCVSEALVAWPFKRKYERVNLVVQAEMRSSSKNYPCRGRTVTVGEGGCYIEVLETLEPSTTVEVVLWLNGEKVLVKAEVASSDRHIGNGLKFVHMAREDAQKLKTFLKAASQEPPPVVRTDAPAPVFEVTRFTPASA